MIEDKYILGLAAVGVLLIILLYIRNKKINNILDTAADYVFYFLDNIYKEQFYTIRSGELKRLHSSNHNVVANNVSRWYLTSGQKELLSRLDDFYTQAVKVSEQLYPLLNEDHYFAHSELESILKKEENIKKEAESFKRSRFLKYAKQNYKTIYENYIQKVFSTNYEAIRNIHNQQFVEKEMRLHRQFFDTILEYPLDSQQRESIVKLEDNCLVVSSAGSGKTSTSLAKVKYLLDKRKVNADEILVLSYNRKTALEFGRKLKDLGILDVTCKTFHSLARSIVGTVDDQAPDIADEKLYDICYRNLIKDDKKFKESVTTFYSEVASLIKPEHSYATSEEYYKDRSLYGSMSPYPDMDGSSIYTRSEEERKICIWLSEHNVKFRYEESYENNLSTKEYRQYKPDFSIYYIDNNGEEHRLYLEHFGIDKNNRVPLWFATIPNDPQSYTEANNRYNNEISWKRNTHQRYGTILLETTSAQFHNGTIYKSLEAQLRNFGVPMRKLTAEEKYALMIAASNSLEESIVKLCASFINLMKSNRKTFDSILDDIKKSKVPQDFYNRCEYLALRIIKPLYDEYEATMHKNEQVDYVDLILTASDYLNSGRYPRKYSYILVDEFQDISIDRFNLLQALRKQSPLTKMYCVGDDWQSIYRFSGSDVNLFTNFEDFFGYTERCKIETTYRFGNPTVQDSSLFILKNPVQVEKKVRPYSTKIRTEVEFLPYTDDDDHLKSIKEIVEKIPTEESILFIARYNKEAEIFTKRSNANPKEKRITVNVCGRNIPFMSVHAAKGLEADHVILINCSQDKGGFPSRVSDDPILGYVLSTIDNYEYSEERRLFYVAVTRAKKHTYVLYRGSMPSNFVTEMAGDSTEVFKCPKCQKCDIVYKEENTAKNGSRYRNYRCSNSIAGCDFFWRVFFDSEDEILMQYRRDFSDCFTAGTVRKVPVDQIPNKNGQQNFQGILLPPLFPTQPVAMPSKLHKQERQECNDELPF